MCVRPAVQYLCMCNRCELVTHSCETPGHGTNVTVCNGRFATRWAGTHNLRLAKRDHYQLRQRKASYSLTHWPIRWPITYLRSEFHQFTLVTHACEFVCVVVFVMDTEALQA